MTTLSLPRVPMRVSMRFSAFVRIFQSSLAANIQTSAGGLQVWVGTIQFINLNDNIGGPEMMGFIAGLNGAANRFEMVASDNPKRGAYGGTPLVKTLPAINDTSIDVKGGTFNVTDWGRIGDYFSFTGAQGKKELHILKADADTDGVGDVTLLFEPGIRSAPAINTAVIVEDGIIGRPEGTFILKDPENGWDAIPGNRRSITLPFLEDVFVDLA